MSARRAKLGDRGLASDPLSVYVRDMEWLSRIEVFFMSGPKWWRWVGTGIFMGVLIGLYYILS